MDGKKSESNHLFLSSRDFEPAYLALYRSGELHKRVAAARQMLAECRVCPRDCGVNRLVGETAVCKTGRYAFVSSSFPHFGEEDCLRGWQGSGTIFFSLCNLRCVFCQNYDISQVKTGHETTPQQLAGLMLHLQSVGCHNINFVTPEHVVPQMLEGLLPAIEGGLRLPLVYNTSAYDSIDSLHLLDGIIDIYMPDFKLWHDVSALKYLKAKDYPQVARQAITEMHRQVGVLKIDERGLARRGVLVRHLVMPGMPVETKAIMQFLAQLSADTYVNLMDQYYPAGKVTSRKYSEINRRLSRDEFQNAHAFARDAGLHRFDKRKARIFNRL